MKTCCGSIRRMSTSVTRSSRDIWRSVKSFAASGATRDALENLETAASLLAPWLLLSPGSLRLQALKARIEIERGMALDRSGKSALATAAAEGAVALAEKLAAADTAYLYDLVCALALESRLDPAAAGPPKAALAALRKAVEAGFDNVYKLETDPHLVSLHSLDEFRELIERFKGVKQANPTENAGEPAMSKKPGPL